MQVLQEYDWTKYQTSELVAAFREAAPSVSKLLNSNLLRTEQKGANHDDLVKKIKAGGQHSVYTYLNKIGKQKNTLLNVDLASVAIARNLEVSYMTTDVFGAFKLDDDLSLGEMIAGKESLQWVDKTKKVETDAIVVAVGDVALVAPVIRGEPLLSTGQIKLLADEDIALESASTSEIKVAQAITDLTVYNNKEGITVKATSPYVDLFRGREQEQRELVVATTSIVSSYFQTFTSMKGRDFYKALLNMMVLARKDPSQKQAYDVLISRWDKWLKTTPKLKKPQKIGDFTSGTLDYSRQLLSATRGIRGGDDTDNTAVGYSTYLPFNIPRSLVKQLVRSIDITRILRVFDSTTINIIGPHARQYVEALMLCPPKSLKVVYGPISQYPGWEESCGVFTNKDHNFIINTFSRDSEVTLDTSYLNDKKVKNSAEYPKSRDIKIIDAPADWQSGRFMPSVSIHNLVGYLLPNKASDICNDNYLKCVDAVNLARTYPGHYVHRARDICESFGFPSIPLGALWKYISKVQNISFEEIRLGQMHDIDDLAEYFPDEVRENMVKQIAEVPVVSVEKDIDASDDDYVTDLKKVNDLDDEFDEF